MNEQSLNIYFKNSKENFKMSEYKTNHFKMEVFIKDEASKRQAEELCYYLIKQAEKLTYKIKQYEKNK